MENGRKGEIVGRRVSFPGGDELQCEVAEAKVRGVERSVGRVVGGRCNLQMHKSFTESSSVAAVRSASKALPPHWVKAKR